MSKDENQETSQENETINLESSSFIELGRASVTGNQPEEEDLLADNAPTKQELSFRCDSKERELLNNHFPADV